jgi:hypothetical protein
MLSRDCARARGFSVSFDRHPGEGRGPGTTTTPVAVPLDSGLRRNDETSLHLLPLLPSETLAPDGPGPLWLRVAVDGNARGVATAGTVALALDDLRRGRVGVLPRALVVNTLAGLRPEAVAMIAASVMPDRARLWLGDFSALCGNARLLRNDVAFCHAPPPDSVACRVCVYGQDRAAHLARMRALLAAVPFEVAAPSDDALALFHATFPP